MNEILSITLETLCLISGARLEDAVDESFNAKMRNGQIKETFAFYFASRWFSFQEFPDMQLDIFSEYEKWRRVGLDETDGENIGN